MQNDDISPVDVALATILGSEHVRPDQKAVSFRIDFGNFVNLSALQSITAKGVSRNQLLNDLLAVGIDAVASSLPDGASHAYELYVQEHAEGLSMILEQDGHL
jgi:hypothetical protein